MRLAIVLTCALALCLSAACSDADDGASSTPTAPSLEFAVIDMNAVILGPVQNDDNADLRITLRETNGVSARVNFLRLTCNNGERQEWSAGNIAAERGSNRIEANGRIVMVRRYRCRGSGRPYRLQADLTDANGHPLTIIVAPYHPDWPGV